jgi:hypothetical protein
VCSLCSFQIACCCPCRAFLSQQTIRAAVFEAYSSGRAETAPCRRARPFYRPVPTSQRARPPQFAATEAAAAGYGGIAAVSAAIAIAVSAIRPGLKDLAEVSGLITCRGTRWHRSNPANGAIRSPLRWTCRSLRQLAAELVARGRQVSCIAVGDCCKHKVQPASQ